MKNINDYTGEDIESCVDIPAVSIIGVATIDLIIKIKELAVNHYSNGQIYEEFKSDLAKYIITTAGDANRENMFCNNSLKKIKLYCDTVYNNLNESLNE